MMAPTAYLRHVLRPVELPGRPGFAQTQQVTQQWWVWGGHIRDYGEHCSPSNAANIPGEWRDIPLEVE